MIYDVIIVGGGPAGLAAARFLSKCKMKYLLIEKYVPGGKALKIIHLDNVPCVEPTNGYDFCLKLYSELRLLKAPIIFEEVLGIYKAKTFFIVHTKNYDYETRNVIYSAGTEPRKLYIKNEEQYEGHGLSYCALCDGSAYIDQDVMVLGGGDSAVEAANMLSKICHKVYLVHKKDQLVAQKKPRVRENNNIEIINNTILTELFGYPEVSGVVLQNLITSEITKMNIKCVFAYVGHTPNTQMLEHFEILDEKGYVVVNNELETGIPGLYAIGDCNNKRLKLIITSLSDGITASAHIFRKS